MGLTRTGLRQCALRRDGFRVTVGERTGISSGTVSFWSRHCAERLRYPDPKSQPGATAEALSRHFQNSSYDAAIPVGLDMVDLFVSHGKSFRVPTMLPPTDSFRIASDKRETSIMRLQWESRLRGPYRPNDGATWTCPLFSNIPGPA